MCACWIVSNVIIAMYPSESMMDTRINQMIYTTIHFSHLSYVRASS